MLNCCVSFCLSLLILTTSSNGNSTDTSFRYTSATASTTAELEVTNAHSNLPIANTSAAVFIESSTTLTQPTTWNSISTTITASTTASATTTTATTSQSTTLPSSVDKNEHTLFWCARRFDRVAGLPRFDSAMYESNLNDLTASRLFAGKDQSQFWAMASDYHRQRVFYTDYQSNYFGVYNVADGSHQVLFQGLSFGIDGIAVDWLTGNVYWTDTDLKWITVADSSLKDFTHVVDLSDDVASPSKLAVNPFRNDLFWSERTGTSCRIYRSDLAGRNKTLLHEFQNVLSVDEMVVDVSENRLYWTERIRNSQEAKIVSFSLDVPGQITEHYKQSPGWFRGLASHGNLLYVADVQSRKIFTVNKTDESTTALFLLSRLTIPRSLVIYGSDLQPFSVAQHQAQPCYNHSCSQLCLTTGWDSHICACAQGFILQADGISCGVTLVDDNFVLLLDSAHSRIYQMQLENPASYSALPLTDIGRVRSVDFDFQSSKLYWTDGESGSVIRSFMNGTMREVFLSNIISDAIALDTVSRNVYLADSQLDAIVVASMDLPGVRKTLQVHGIYRIAKLIVSNVLGKVFWTDWAKYDSTSRNSIGKIESMNLDGSGRRIIANDSSGPHGLAIDEQDGILYWSELIRNGISWLKFDTGERGHFGFLESSETIGMVVGLDFHSSFLYVTDQMLPRAYRVASSEVLQKQASNGSDVLPYGPNVFYSLSGVKVEKRSDEITGDTTSCTVNKGGCTEICLPQTTGRKCVCGDHSAYSAHNNTCTQLSSADDETAPSFHDTCPDYLRIVGVDPCASTRVVNFTPPVATDDSNFVIVKSFVNGDPPYTLPAGSHLFTYRAQDRNANVAYCRFIIIVLDRVRCGSFRLPSGTVALSEQTCGNRFGSTIDIICENAPEVSFQYQCQRNGIWAPNSQIVCPDEATRPPTDSPSSTLSADTTTTAATTTVSDTSLSESNQGALQMGGLNAGYIVLIVAIVLIVVGILILLLRKYRFHPSLSKNIFWQRGEDEIRLAEDMERVTPTSEGNVYT